MTKRSKKIIVNGLSLSRLVASLFLPIIFWKVNFGALVITLIVLSLTDCADGILARKWKVATVGGSLLDPLGDKVLPIACLLAQIKTKWYLALLIVLEMMIISLNVYRAFRHEVTSSSWAGKIKTWLLSITVISATANLFWQDIVSTIFKWTGMTIEFVVSDEIVLGLTILTIVAEVITFGGYLVSSLKSRVSRGQPRKLKNVREILTILFDEERYAEDKKRPIIDIITDMKGGQ